MSETRDRRPTGGAEGPSRAGRPSSRTGRGAIFRAGIVALSAAALFAAWHYFPLKEWLSAFQAWIAGMGVLGGVVFGAAYVVACLLFVPGLPLSLAAGVVFGVLWGSVIVSIASTITTALAFLIARYSLRARVEKFARGNPRFGAIDGAIRRNGWKIVALLRLSPVVPFSVSNYLFGVTSVRFFPYLAASWIGMLPATILYVAIGAAGHGSGAGQRRPVEWVLLGAGVLATAGVTIFLARVARRELDQTKAGSK